MPIRKFHSIEEMSAPVWRKAGDLELFRVMAALWELGTRTTMRRYPPGVHKHAGVEEMTRVQDAWAETAHAAARRLLERG